MRRRTGWRPTTTRRSCARRFRTRARNDPLN
jgi:hypothetical protein